MIFDYKCFKGKSKSDSWYGQVQLLKIDHPYEMKVTARGSCFYMIYGHYSYGEFICIPSNGVTAEIASLEDTFWNLESITRNNPKLPKIDAISIVYALKAICPYLKS